MATVHENTSSCSRHGNKRYPFVEETRLCWTLTYSVGAFEFPLTRNIHLSINFNAACTRATSTISNGFHPLDESLNVDAKPADSTQLVNGVRPREPQTQAHEVLRGPTKPQGDNPIINSAPNLQDGLVQEPHPGVGKSLKVPCHGQKSALQSCAFRAFSEGLWWRMIQFPFGDQN